MRLAPAKTNLFLEVPARRADGFHELDTVFVELELADRLSVEPAETLDLQVLGDDTVPGGEGNLVWRAADALRRAADQPDAGAKIVLEKSIPSGGGLGGGSSNAAATLLALDAHWQTNVGAAALHGIAAGLGSDVAFFLRGGLQRGRGRGELLEPLSPLVSPLELLLCFPPFPCPTPQVFGALAPFLPATPRSPEPLLSALSTGDVHAIGKELFNRLEAPAFAEFPELARLKTDLAARPGVVATLLSGSGSTLLCLMESAAAATREQTALAGEGLRCVATRTATGGGTP